MIIVHRMSEKQTAFKMSSKQNSDYFMTLVVILLSVFIKLSATNEASARSLDLSWRPLSHSPYQQQFFQNGPPAALISYSHFDAANKEEIVEAAKHNAQLLKKFKEIAHNPITSYSDPYMYSQTPGPSTTVFLNPNLVRHQQQQQQQQQVAAASNHVLQRLPFPGKSAPLYQTKLNYLGKQDGNSLYHQNSIHQTPGTTAKIAGFTKEHGRVNLHYHHPSFGMAPIASTTKRIPIFSSSVTPHPNAKNHPVMNKFQAHMALAAASQSHHHKLKQNSGFSPPSQIMSNYANFGPATSNPFWHHGLKNSPFNFVYNNQDFHHHFHKSPESQPQQQKQQQHQQQHQQQVLPSVHPSVLTPFLEQVQLKQKEAAAAEQKNALKQSHETNSHENNGSFEIINDIFSKHLVPPPPSHQSPTSYKNKPEKQEKTKTYNLSMPSPLQDASRFNYNNVISTATPTNDNLRFRPSASDNNYNYFTTDKPNVFIHLNNRTKDNVYKQHKLLHPSYTGGLKKKPFLPTPYRPEKEEEPLRIGYETEHSFFTIEDAVTPNIPAYQVIKSHIPVEEEPEAITYAPRKKPEYDYSVTIAPTQKPTTTTSVAPPVEQSTQKPRQKLRRRKPRPQQQQKQQQQQQQHQHITETTASAEQVKSTVKPRDHFEAKPSRVRGSIKNVDTQTEQNELRTRNRVNHPNRVRNRVSLTSPAATLSTLDYDSTIRSSTEEEKKNEVTTTQQVTTESTSLKSEESSEQPENLTRRVKLRFKNKFRANTNTNSLEPTELKQKLSDNQISDTENDNIVIKQDEITETNIVTESGLNEIRSSLKLPNLKLRNEALTTLPTTADTISTSVQPSSTTAVEQEEIGTSNNKINRPRFSIKEFKRKPFVSTSTATTLISSSTTASTTTRPDGQRFNRLRVNLRRRNETTDSGEEVEIPRKRFSTTRTTTTTTVSPVQTSSLPRRGSLPKRTFPPRNFTKPTVNLNEIESSTASLGFKPFIKNTTTSGSNRPSSPNLRSRIQNYKKKETSYEVSESAPESIKTINLSSETSVTQEQPSSPSSSTTSTESPYRHETSIMKIAKTPLPEKSTTTTNDFSDVSDTSDNISRNDFDLTVASSEHSQRVADLTISGSDSYQFKSANIGPLSRRIPNYFTISTDDPILPIQAFFPQIKTNENN